MKKHTLLCCLIVFAISLSGCAPDQNIKEEEKYSMDATLALGTVDNSTLDKTRITYEVMISGRKDDINSIVSQEPLINMEYLGLMLEDGPHHSQIEESEDPHLEIEGSFVFYTDGKSKEEIENMHLFEGIKIIDKDKNEYLLKFKKMK